MSCYRNILIILSLVLLLISCSEQGNSKLIKKANAGDAEAQLALGDLYKEGGEGIVKDLVTAVEWYTKAAEQGIASAQYNLGRMYYNGEGVAEDKLKAVELYTKAAEQGDADAQFNLGVMYYNGDGVAEDKLKAVEWYTKAAEQGDAYAQFALGYMYEYGDGVTQDKKKATDWYTKAAEQGYAGAQFNLGRMYEYGEGVAEDKIKAVEWYTKAAKQGVAVAQYNLGRMYSNGEGVAKDRVLSYAWLNLAAITEAEAANLRDGLELSQNEQAEAEKLSSSWKPGQAITREGSTPVSMETPSGNEVGPVKHGTGTLFVVSEAGQAITNFHVVSECKKLTVAGYDDEAKVLAEDKVNDLALIQVSSKVQSSATIVTAPSTLRQGEEVVVFGFPLNTVLSSGGNLTPGIVSALTGLGNNISQMQITAPIQPGSSGSPVLNRRGEVIGVVTLKLSDEEMVKATGQIAQSVNFATKLRNKAMQILLMMHASGLQLLSAGSRDGGLGTIRC